MPDVIRDPLAGPDGMLDTERKPTRGEWHMLAVLALRVLRVPVPTSRYEATVAAVRLLRQLQEEGRA